MDMLKGEQIAEANLTDWRKLAQGLHARYLVDDFGTAAVRRRRGEAGDTSRTPPAHVDRQEIDQSGTAAHLRDNKGTEHAVQVTSRTSISRDRSRDRRRPMVYANPASVSDIELALERRAPRPSPQCGPPC